MVAEPGHIGNHQSTWLRTCHGGHMVDHNINSYRQRILVTEHRSCQRITNQDDINSSAVNDLGARSIIGRNHRELGTMLASQNRWYSNFVFHNHYPYSSLASRPVSQAPSACKTK